MHGVALVIIGSQLPKVMGIRAQDETTVALARLGEAVARHLWFARQTVAALEQSLVLEVRAIVVG